MGDGRAPHPIGMTSIAVALALAALLLASVRGRRLKASGLAVARAVALALCALTVACLCGRKLKASSVVLVLAVALPVAPPSSPDLRSPTSPAGTR